jgi:virulence-associated protein VagC
MTEIPVKLLRIDGDQVVEIPPEFELQSEYVILRRCGDRLIIEPALPPHDSGETA